MHTCTLIIILPYKRFEIKNTLISSNVTSIQKFDSKRETYQQD